MTTSSNGWSASPDLARRDLIINGVAFVGGIRDDDDVETVLRYVVEQWAARVEPLKSPGCWGFTYRDNRNDPSSLSNHSSGTAVDVNAPAHPNGVAASKTLTPAQLDTLRAIADEVDQCVRFGAFYNGTPDAMHAEINVDAATLHATAERLRGDVMTDEQMNALTGRLDLIVKALADLQTHQREQSQMIRRLGNQAGLEPNKPRK